MIQMFEFLALVQVKLSPFVQKVIVQFTLSQFDWLPFIPAVDSVAKTSDDMKEAWMSNFSPTDYSSKVFIYNAKEAICIFAIMLVVWTF